MHLKNFSLIENESRGYVLSPAYDLLPVNLLIDDRDEMALSMNEKKRDIRREDFLRFADSIGIDFKVANIFINRIIKFVPDFQKLIDESLLDDDYKEKFKRMMNERMERLS